MSLIACEDRSNQTWARQESPPHPECFLELPVQIQGSAEIPRESYQNKPQLHKILKAAVKFPLSHILIDIGKNLPPGPVPCLAAAHGYSSHHGPL